MKPLYTGTPKSLVQAGSGQDQESAFTLNSSRASRRRWNKVNHLAISPHDDLRPFAPVQCREADNRLMSAPIAGTPEQFKVSEQDCSS